MTKQSDPKPLKLIFKQTRMEAFFDKRVNIEDRHRIVSIDKNIVEVVVYEMLYNLNDENHQLASDRAMDVFKPVLSIKDDGSKIVERFNVVISAPMEFDYVVSLLATGLSFNQISTVIDCNQTVLETGKQKSLSPREVFYTSRIVCSIALQLLSDLMRNSWAFLIATDASTDEFGNDHLDARIRLPSVQIGKTLLSFHLLAILLFNESHSGQSLYEFMTRLLNALCPD